MNVNNNQQHSLDWYRNRLGRITGSRVGEIFQKGRAKDDIFSKTALAYLTSVAAEQMLPDFMLNDDESLSLYLDEVNVTSKAMRIGSEREAEARNLYAEITAAKVEECGCIQHPGIKGFASSPDGLILTDSTIQGTIEIKCPKPATYLEYLSTVHSAETLKAANTNYYWQCLSHMAVTGARWCDFIVYCPYNTTPLHIVRVQRDEQAIDQLYERLHLALAKVSNIASMATKHP